MSTAPLLTAGQTGSDTNARGTLRALAWNYSGAVVGTVIQLCYTAYTGRVVRPGPYGAYMTASSALTVLGLFASTGLATYVLRDEQLTWQKVRTAWMVSAVSGSVCCAFVLAIAPLLAAVWQLPQTVPLIRLCGLMYLLQPAASVAAGALRRLGQARFSAIVELLAQSVGMAAGAVLLGVGWNPEGMVVYPAITAAFTLVLSARRVVGCRFEDGPRVSAASLVGRSSAFAGYSVIQSLTANAPMWAVARLLGPASAGQFSRAFITVNLPLTVLFESLYRAVIPSVARINGMGRPVGDAALDVLNAASAVAFLSFGAMGGVGPFALRLLLGPGWEDACSLVPVMCVGAAFAMLYATGFRLDEVRNVMRHLTRLHLTVLGATLAVVAVTAVTTHSAVLITAAASAAAGFSHVLQLVRWRRERLFRLASLVRPYLVHAAIGMVLFGTGYACASLARTPTIAIGYGLLGMAPVALTGLAMRRRLPLYEAAVARGLVSG